MHLDAPRFLRTRNTQSKYHGHRHTRLVFRCPESLPLRPQFSVRLLHSSGQPPLHHWHTQFLPLQLSLHFPRFLLLPLPASSPACEFQSIRTESGLFHLQAAVEHHLKKSSLRQALTLSEPELLQCHQAASGQHPVRLYSHHISAVQWKSSAACQLLFP